MILSPLFEVFENDIGVEEYFHHSSTVLDAIFLLEIIFDEFFLRGIAAKDAAKSLVSIAAFRFGRGDELLGVSRELLLQ